LSLTNPIDVVVRTGAFSVTVAEVVTPPFTAGDSKVTLSNEPLGEVGCVVEDVGCVMPWSSEPHAAVVQARTAPRRQRRRTIELSWRRIGRSSRSALFDLGSFSACDDFDQQNRLPCPTEAYESEFRRARLRRVAATGIRARSRRA
jgi:hypothetical protein